MSQLPTQNPAEPGLPPAAPAGRNRKLGRGLASLMSNTRQALADPAGHDVSAISGGTYAPAAAPIEAAAKPSEKPMEIPISSIQPNPYQPRRAFDEGSLVELADSIRRQGVLQPLLVMHASDGLPGYVLIAGERRLRAARQAGLSEVPCVVRQGTRQQMLEWALIENIQRSDLNPVDRAVAYRDYMDRFGLSQQQVAERLSEPRSTVSNYLRILDLSDSVRAMVIEGDLSFGHAKVLAALAGQPARQLDLARKTIEAGFSVRHLEQLVAEAVGRPAAPAEPTRRGGANTQKSQHILDLERQLSRVVGTRVTIHPGRAKNTGRIVLEYYSLDDFDRISEALGAKLEG